MKIRLAILTAVLTFVVGAEKVSDPVAVTPCVQFRHFEEKPRQFMADQ